jgi:RsiW-degrading membrane proteinase PrsW (M82 family)
VLQFGRFLSGDVLYGGYLMVQTIRLISLPFQHCIWSAIAGYYVGLACLHPRRAAGLVTVGVVTATILHGVYDLFAGGWMGLLVFGISILLFAGYCRSADDIGEALTAQDGPSPPNALLAVDTLDVP